MLPAKRQGHFETVDVIDLFSGTGALSFGLELGDSDFRTIGGIDLDPAACETARSNHPNATILSVPIGRLGPDRFASEVGCTSVDVIVGGPPCQGFSSLRPSRGTSLDDPRNELYRDFALYVSVLRPRVFLLENVVGIVNATKGYLLADLIAQFEGVGYRTDWRILNAANYGVPQKRERFFLLGVRGNLDDRGPVAFPEPTHSFSGKTIGIRDRSRIVSANGSAPSALTAWDAISDLPSLEPGERAEHYARPPQNPYQRRMRAGSRTLTLHMAANHNEKMRAVMALAGESKSALPPGMVSSGYSSCYSRIRGDEPAPTITVKFTSPASSKCIHPFDQRAITPREAARIQGFPDRFEFRGTKTDIASQIGNAVPPILASHFAPVIKAYIR